MKSSSFP